MFVLKSFSGVFFCGVQFILFFWHSYRKRIILNTSVGPINATVRGTNSSGMNRPGSNGNKRVFLAKQISNTEA